MLPFSVDRMILEMRHDMDAISHDIIKHKFNFCNAFEKELGLGASEYSQTVFDYLFNLFFFKKAFGDADFKRLIEDVHDLDFQNPQQTCAYISAKYSDFLVVYHKYFMDYFGFNHQDDLYIARKINDNRETFRRKLLEYY